MDFYKENYNPIELDKYFRSVKCNEIEDSDCNECCEPPQNRSRRNLKRKITSQVRGLKKGKI